MLQFIIFDDNKLIREKVSKVITKLMLPTDIEYQTKEFSQYDKSFSQFIEKRREKIYILDIEVNSFSGLDVARKIREKTGKALL